MRRMDLRSPGYMVQGLLGLYCINMCAGSQCKMECVTINEKGTCGCSEMVSWSMATERKVQLILDIKNRVSGESKKTKLPSFPA
jgi:hypothetical protein